MSKKYKNKLKTQFIDRSPKTSLGSSDEKLTEKCKFNFAYFETGQIPPGQDFKDWTHKQLIDLLNKLKDYSKHPLSYWKTQTHSRQKVLEIYGNFPEAKSDFWHPTNIPADVEWGRFTLGAKSRLVGFTIPEKLDNTTHPSTGYTFDKNTFYIVFLDKEHKFYKTEKKS